MKKADKFYTTSEALEYIKPKVTLRRLQQMIKDNHFPNAKKFGRDWLIPASDLDLENERRKNNAWIKKQD